MRVKQNQFKELAVFFRKLATAIVSGLPKRKIFYRPANQSGFYTKKRTFKPVFEKHYHRPKSKPATEKQTLLKEKKKVKAVH